MKTKKILALVLSVLMLATLLPNVAFAADLPGFKVVFKNASGNTVNSAKPGEKLTAEVYLPEGTYASAAVTLVPNDNVEFSNIVGAEGISYAALNIIAQNGRAQAKFSDTGGVSIGKEPYFKVDVTIPSTAEAGFPIVLFIILNGSNAVKGGETYTIPTDGWGIMIPKCYDITDKTAQDANGSIEIDNTTAAENDIVTVTVKPNSGYRLKTLTVLSAVSIAPPITPTQDTQDKTKYTFAMPAHAVNVVAEFDVAYSVFNAGNGKKIIGEEGKLPAEKPVWDGYTFEGWYNDKGYTDKTEESDVVAGATYYAKWTNNITKKTVLIQPVTVEEDGLHLGDSKTAASETELSKYGIKFTLSVDENPAVLELDGTTIMAPGKYCNRYINDGADGIYSIIFNRSFPLEISVKSESNIISDGYDYSYSGGLALYSVYSVGQPLTVSGKMLNIIADGGNECVACMALYEEGASLYISGSLNVKAVNLQNVHAIYSGSYLTIKDNAVVTAKAISTATGNAVAIGSKNELNIIGDAVVTAKAINTAAGESVAITSNTEVNIIGDAVVTATAEGGSCSDALVAFGTGSDALLIGGNAVVKAYGGNGTKEWYAVWMSQGGMTVKENAKVYLYGGINPESGEKEAMFIPSKKQLILNDNAQLISDGSLMLGDERNIILGGEPVSNAVLSVAGDIKAYISGNVSIINANGSLEDSEGLTRINKNAPIILIGKQSTVKFEGIDGEFPFAGKVTKPSPDPVKNGYDFGGWFTDKNCTNAWNFDTDAVFEDTTFYPKWINENTAVLANSMAVVGDSALGSEGEEKNVLIEVYNGSAKIKSIITDENGRYDLGYLAPADYTLKITTNGRTVTELLHIEKDYTPSNMSLTRKIGTDVEIVESGSDTPHTMVGGLSKLAQSYNDGNRSDLSFTVEAQNNENVSVSAKDAITAEISGNKTIVFVDMSIFREYIGGADNGKREPIHESSAVLEIVMNYDTVKRQNIEVFRYHDGGAQAFTKLETRPTDAFVDGTYYVGNGFIVIYADKFSEYAIGYNTSSGRRSSGGFASSNYTVKFDTNGGNEMKNISVKVGQKIGTIETPKKDGFVFDGWFSDKELTKPFNADDKVTKSTTLYANWKVDPVRQITLTIGKKEATVFTEAKANDVAPVIRNDRTMLPIRFVAEALGATVLWDGEKQLVTISNESLKIEITIGESVAFVNGVEVELDSPAFIENDRTYLPLRFVAENLGANVEWIEESQQVVITR